MARGLCAQHAQAVGHDQQAGTHVGKHSHPHGGHSGQGQHQKDQFDADGKGNVLHQHLVGAARQAHGFGHAAQVVVHDDHIGSFHRHIGACSAHGKANVGLGQRGRIVDAVTCHGRHAVLALQSRNGSQFVLGQHVGLHLVDARCASRSLRCGSVVAGQHHRLDAQRPQGRDRRHRLRAHGVGHGKHGMHTRAVGQQGDAAALRFVHSGGSFYGFGPDAQLTHPAPVAQVPAGATSAVHAAFHASASACAEVFQLGQAAGSTRQTCGDGRRHRVVRTRRQGQRHVVRGVIAKRVVPHQYRAAGGDGAGFVKRHHFDVACLLQPHTAFDQNAAARASRQRTDHGHRRGQHKCARAGNHQQHQGAVDSVKPGPAEHQWRAHSHHQGHHKHGRRVHRCKAVHQPLGGRARGLCVFYGVDDAVQRGVPGSRRHAHFQLGLGVERAGKQRVAQRLVDGQTLAGQAGFIHCAAAACHAAVQRHAAARTNAHGAAHRYVGGGHAAPLPIGAQHVDSVRAERQQCANRVARAAYCALFYPLGQCIQRHHHGRFRPLANQECAGHRDRHQGADSQLGAHQRANAGLVHAQPGQPDGQRRQCHAAHLPWQSVGA